MRRLLIVLAACLWGLLIVWGGYAWGAHAEGPEPGYCDFYPHVCAQNGGKAPW